MKQSWFAKNKFWIANNAVWGGIAAFTSGIFFLISYMIPFYSGMAWMVPALCLKILFFIPAGIFAGIVVYAAAVLVVDFTKNTIGGFFHGC